VRHPCATPVATQTQVEAGSMLLSLSATLEAASLEGILKHVFVPSHGNVFRHPLKLQLRQRPSPDLHAHTGCLACMLQWHERNHTQQPRSPF